VILITQEDRGHQHGDNIIDFSSPGRRRREWEKKKEKKHHEFFFSLPFFHFPHGR